MTSETDIVVVANGDLTPTASLLAILDEAQAVIAADGGANVLVAMGRYPDVVVGDMDTVSAEVLAQLASMGCRLVRHRPDKDETDTELALLEAVAMGATRITLLGALGGRIDHEIANLLLLFMRQLDGIETVIYDGRSWLRVIDQAMVIRGRVGDTVSLLPFGGDVEGIITSGLAYPLCDETLSLSQARGVSNVLVEPEARIRLRRGRLLLVHTPANRSESGNERQGLDG